MTSRSRVEVGRIWLQVTCFRVELSYHKYFPSYSLEDTPLVILICPRLCWPHLSLLLAELSGASKALKQPPSPTKHWQLTITIISIVCQTGQLAPQRAVFNHAPKLSSYVWSSSNHEPSFLSLVRRSDNLSPVSETDTCTSEVSNPSLYMVPGFLQELSNRSISIVLEMRTSLFLKLTLALLVAHPKPIRAMVLQRPRSGPVAYSSPSSGGSQLDSSAGLGEPLNVRDHILIHSARFSFH